MPLRNVAEYLERSAARVPDKTAFSDAAGAVSYRQMLHDAQEMCIRDRGRYTSIAPGSQNSRAEKAMAGMPFITPSSAAPIVPE